MYRVELDGYDLRVVCESLEIASEVKKVEVKHTEKQIKVERDPEEIEALIYRVYLPLFLFGVH